MCPKIMIRKDYLQTMFLGKCYMPEAKALVQSVCNGKLKCDVRIE